jgi:AraC family transcriptional regulator
MLQTNSLKLDLKSENASLQILLVTPIISSFKAGWNGAYLKYYTLPPHSMPEYSPAQHVIISHNHSGGFNVTRKLDGHQQKDSMINGDVVIVPANIYHGASWDTDISITVMILEPLHFARIAHDSIEPDSMELVPHFSKPDALISQIILALKTEIETGAAGSNLYAESMITALFAHLLRHYSTRNRSLPNYQDGLPKYRLKRAIEYIHDHIGEGFSLETLASVVGMSQFHFARMFKQSTGLTPHQYLVEQRLEKAKKLLVDSDLTISDVAYNCGFASQSHLTRLFRKHLNTTPKGYRQIISS